MSTHAKKNHSKEKSSPTAKKIQKGCAKGRRSQVEQGSFRVIGGVWRSRRLLFPAVEGLRPTTDRVRETLFNWLSSELQGAHVLDVFSGSGALGLEALSRGAANLLAIEKDRMAAQALQDNVTRLVNNEITHQQIKIVNQDALMYLTLARESSGHENGSDSYDLIFLDPPFRKGILEEVIEILDEHPLIADGALLYIEREKEMQQTSLPKTWSLLKEKVAGQVSYQLYRVNKAR